MERDIHITTIDQCMDVFDHYDPDLLEYLHHIMVSKIDADARVQRTLPSLIARAADLIAAHAGTEDAYPAECLVQQPA